MKFLDCGENNTEARERHIRQTLWYERISRDLRILKIFKFRKLLTLRRGRSCAGPNIMSQLLLKICRTFFEGRHKTGPCMWQTWIYVIVGMRNLN